MVLIFEVEKCYIPYFAGKISGFIINSDSFINQKAKDQKNEKYEGTQNGREFAFRKWITKIDIFPILSI